MKRADFSDLEPPETPPPSCSWVLSKPSIRNCTAPWSRCSFRTQSTEWGSKKSGSFKVLIEQLRNQETYEEGFWGWSQNPLRTLWPWWIPPTINHLLLISSLGPLPSSKKNCIHLFIYPVNTFPHPDYSRHYVGYSGWNLGSSMLKIRPGNSQRARIPQTWASISQGILVICKNFLCAARPSTS